MTSYDATQNCCQNGKLLIMSENKYLQLLKQISKLLKILKYDIERFAVQVHESVRSPGVETALLFCTSQTTDNLQRIRRMW